MGISPLAHVCLAATYVIRQKGQKSFKKRHTTFGFPPKSFYLLLPTFLIPLATTGLWWTPAASSPSPLRTRCATQSQTPPGPASTRQPGGGSSAGPGRVSVMISVNRLIDWSLAATTQRRSSFDQNYSFWALRGPSRVSKCSFFSGSDRSIVWKVLLLPSSWGV